MKEPFSKYNITYRYDLGYYIFRCWNGPYLGRYITIQKSFGPLDLFEVTIDPQPSEFNLLSFTKWNGRNFAGLKVSHSPMHKLIFKNSLRGPGGFKMSVCLSVRPSVRLWPLQCEISFDPMARLWSNFQGPLISLCHTFSEMGREGKKMLGAEFWFSAYGPKKWGQKVGLAMGAAKILEFQNFS